RDFHVTGVQTCALPIYKLIKRSGEKGFLNALGNSLVKALPVIIKALGIIGTIALILVSGGIFVHQIDYFHHLLPGLPSIVKEIRSEEHTSELQSRENLV